MCRLRVADPSPSPLTAPTHRRERRGTDTASEALRQAGRDARVWMNQFFAVVPWCDSSLVVSFMGVHPPRSRSMSSVLQRPGTGCEYVVVRSDTLPTHGRCKQHSMFCAANAARGGRLGWVRVVTLTGKGQCWASPWRLSWTVASRRTARRPRDDARQPPPRPHCWRPPRPGWHWKPRRQRQGQQRAWRSSCWQVSRLKGWVEESVPSAHAHGR